MTLTQKVKYSQIVTLLSYFLLLALMVVSTALSTLPPEASRGFMLAVKVVPLLIFLPGLLKGNLRAHIWLCFVVLFYFTRSVVDAFLTEGAILEAVITTTTVVVFVAAMMNVFWQKKTGARL
ncbi:DUF2069 domain-containing protein [Alkalimarinus sediminis]|uniref:DUF2069 domain-containing protein n=1 Tax=Alkalimarinus sediminis TaxID=1632866 RepID=A0A9E8HMI1_9ALTE|nr:DUF2069 domain-containing protein [Alkalimarinus sediminis]UZW75616.1 DUF2069 domain-containing protein [Alkalimarinus sediminis]